jgi:coenzyme F420-reducing hydrogenase gamma subunit
VDEALAIVYASPHYIKTLARSRPASDYVAVDLELQGCPINKRQLLGVLAQMLLSSRPRVENHALCLDCKRQGLVCVLVARGAPCMGPVTTTGCGVLCPSYDRPCYSCF